MTFKKKKIDSVLMKVEDGKTSVSEADLVSNIPINIDIPKKEETVGATEETPMSKESPEIITTEETLVIPTGENNKKYVRAIEIMAVAFLVIIIAGFFVFKWGESSKMVTYTAPDQGKIDASAPIVVEPVKESFVVQDIGGVVGSSKENIATADPKIFKPSTDFKTFSYDASVGKIVSLSGTCRDSYYVILIFEDGRDYRKEPSASRYNSAFPCPSGGKFNAEINLKEANLPSGKYYMFIADQGDTGSWYNPR